MTTAPDIGPAGLALAAALIAGHAVTSVAFQLGLGRRLVVAAVRATVQLLLLGWALERVFAAQQPVLVVGVMTLMGLVAGREALRRTTHTAPGLGRATTLAMLGSSFLVTTYGLVAVLDAEPWWAPERAIPIMGMVLGNTLNGIALGLDATLKGLESRSGEIEGLLAMGASPARATRALVQDALRTATLPIVNSMAVVGIVSIPGMMTGQILGGGDPGIAARYQLFILFAIASGTALGAVLVVLSARRLLFDDRERLRLDRLSPRAS